MSCKSIYAEDGKHIFDETTLAKYKNHLNILIENPNRKIANFLGRFFLIFAPPEKYYLVGSESYKKFIFGQNLTLTQTH